MTATKNVPSSSSPSATPKSPSSTVSSHTGHTSGISSPFVKARGAHEARPVVVKTSWWGYLAGPAGDAPIYRFRPRTWRHSGGCLTLPPTRYALAEARGPPMVGIPLSWNRNRGCTNLRQCAISSPRRSLCKKGPRGRLCIREDFRAGNGSEEQRLWR